jgi:Uma2 family endonuclease
MNNGKLNDDSGFEPIWEPLIRVEATFHPGPGYEYLNEARLGESEPCEMAPMISVQTNFRPVAETPRRLSIQEYHKLVANGALTTDDRVELLEGFLVQKKPSSPPRDSTLQLLNHELIHVLPAAWDMRVRCAVTLSDSEPEPDIAIVRGTNRSYFRRHPGPADIGALVEVADSTLLGDRADKGRIYARANVPIYWIVNLIDRQIEVYEQPSGPTSAPAFAKTTTYREGDSIPLVLDGKAVATYAVKDLLP